MTNIIKDLTQKNNELLARIEELEKEQIFNSYNNQDIIWMKMSQWTVSYGFENYGKINFSKKHRSGNGVEKNKIYVKNR